LPRHLPSLLVLFVLIPTAVLACTSIVHAQPPWVNVNVFPSFVTPNDQIFVQANVTSAIEIKNVTMFYRFGPSGLKFSSKSDYNSTLMVHVTQRAQWGLWEWSPLQKFPANTFFYFFVEATNIAGDASSWPGNIPQESNPQVVPIRNPDESYLYSLIVTVNNLDLGAKLQRANITVDLGAYMPHFPEDYVVPADVYSGPYFDFEFGLVEETMRFDYHGKASGWATLTNGHIDTAPFDNYTLSLRIDLPYQIMNLTRSVDMVPVVFNTVELWNSWNISPSDFSWERSFFAGRNSTSILIQTTIARNGVTGFMLTYPPLVLLLTGFGILGVVPLIAKYHEDKRFDVYLNVIILAASAELSQNVFLPAGVLLQNFFTNFFAYVLFFSVVMILISGLSPDTKRLPRGIPIESYATVAMTVLIAVTIYNWTIPLTAKILSVLLIASGVLALAIIGLGRYICRKAFAIEQPLS
jgi:hypothetical protein